MAINSIIPLNHSVSFLPVTCEVQLTTKKVTGISMLDLSKTFDSTQHKILLAKLNTLDVSSEALSWFESCHTDRQQFVQRNSFRSNPLTVSHGVTQGLSLRTPLI